MRGYAFGDRGRCVAALGEVLRASASLEATYLLAAGVARRFAVALRERSGRASDLGDDLRAELLRIGVEPASFEGDEVEERTVLEALASCHRAERDLGEACRRALSGPLSPGTRSVLARAAGGSKRARAELEDLASSVWSPAA